MKPTDQKITFDDFELETNYDFSGGVRGRFYIAEKITETIQLDSDVLLFLKKQAIEKHTDYQTLLNTLLRDYMSNQLLGSHS